jgi:hypothetical protein
MNFQSIALNFQTNCVNMALNTALFLRNGMTGYRLKPAYMRLYRDLTTHSLRPADDYVYGFKIRTLIKLISAF